MVGRDLEDSRLAMSASQQWRRHGPVTVLSGDFGKPRPARVIRSAAYLQRIQPSPSSLTGDLFDAPNIPRRPLQPNEGDGLQLPSQIMIDRRMRRFDETKLASA